MSFLFAGKSSPNYFGDGSDGDVTISSNTFLTPNFTPDSQDGDMVVRQFSGLTVNSGDILTTSQSCRGLFIYSNGDVVVDGKISMTNRGPDADPFSSGSSDSNDVNSAGLQYPFVTDSGASNFNLDGTSFNGCGNPVKNAISGGGSVSNAEIHTIPRTQNNGGAYSEPGVDTNNATIRPSQMVGGFASSTNVGCGGGGAGGQAYESFNGHGGDGGNSSCFSGGAAGGGGAGGGAANSGHRGENADDLGGNGGDGGDHNENPGRPAGTGGAGNPPGQDSPVGTKQTNTAEGTGGLLFVIANGDINISSNGSIQANGGQGSDSSATSDNSAMGGGGGGGHVVLAATGDVIADGNTVSPGDYVGNAGQQIGSKDSFGVVEYNIQAWGGRGGKNNFTTTCPQQDMYVENQKTRQGGHGGKGLISIFNLL